MQILLAKKQPLLSFTLGVITLLFSSMSFSYDPGLNYLPARDDSGTASIDESEQGCVYRESDAAGANWTVDDCDYIGAHYACYNGTEWQVAQALGTTTSPGEPQDGNEVAQQKSVDYWDPIKADSQCKILYGPSYFFSVPVNDEENAKLGDAISDIEAAKTRTWVYYYSNTQNIPLSSNYWLGNRTEYTNLLSGGQNNTGGIGGVADCTLIDHSTGLWQDAPCSEEYSFACYDSGSWLITSEKGEWKEGFAICDENYGLQSLYAVPRDLSENNAIIAAALPVGASNEVWLNRSDLAFEEFFVSNQTRQAWWGAGEPKGVTSKNCAVIDSSGNWIAESCDGFDGYHACYLNSASGAQWQLTKDVPDLKKTESSMGFGYCKRLADNADYRPPSSAASNAALAALLSPGEFVWINYSDRINEGSWLAGSQYQDFVTIADVIEGEAKDCGYFSLETDNKKSWMADQCFAGGASLVQGFACYNDFEWKIATQASVGGASLESDLWKDGFAACEAAFGKDYQFSTPSDAWQNARLALALRLSGNTQAWMNVNDSLSEGNWVSNGPVVNLAPVLTLSSQREFEEKESIDLSVAAIDPETNSNAGLTYQWSIIEERVGADNTGTDTVVTPILSNANTSTVTIPAVDLISDDYYLDIQLQVTDADATNPSTRTQVITIKITSPLRAAYDFNNFVNPELDISGNGNDLNIDTSFVEITARDNNGSDYFAKMDGTDLFTIDGSSASFSQISVKDEYTLVYRFKLEALPTSNLAGFVQKGAGVNSQPGLFYDKTSGNIQFNNTTTNSTESELNLEDIRLDQWVTVAYVKSGSDSKLYVDKAELKTPVDPNPLQVIPDSTKTLLGASIYTSNDWTFGNVPGASEGIIGGFDDIRIYERALTAPELVTIFPDQSRGVFEFTNTQAVGDENAVDGAVTELDIPVSRLTGDDGEVSVAYNLISGSAILGTDFRLKNDIPALGEGILSWGVHDAADKNITVELIGDALREGTESFTIELERLGSTEPELGDNSNINVNIIDKTPNPFGAVGIAPTTLVNNIQIDEGQAGFVTVERAGSDSLGAFDVTYEIEALTANSTSDFTITQAGFTTTGSGTNVVIGTGRLSFPNNASGSAVTQQTQTISFTTAPDTDLESDEAFIVRLLAVTDPGVATLADPANSAILGTVNEFTQVVRDISPGRISLGLASYSIDEVDQGSSSNTTLISLDRLGGDDGEMCVTLSLVLGGIPAESTADYTINYLSPSTSGQSDIYWEDQDDTSKLVQITAINDEVFEAAEVIELFWERKALCNGSTTAVPFAAEGSDNASAEVTINDYTTPIKLKFTETSYTVDELTATKTITIQATQSRLAGNPSEGDFADGNRVNNNNFVVDLTRVDSTAFEGIHYGDLSALDVLTFLPGETVKTINVPIVDNCVATPSLTVGFGLVASAANTLPSSLIDVSSASSSLAITNASAPIVVSGFDFDGTGIAAANNAGWKNGSSGLSNIAVTGPVSASAANPQITEMRLKADISHNCLTSLTAVWNYDSASPSLPSSGILPTSFSVNPVITASSGNALLTDVILMPFVIEPTDLNFSLTVTDPEIGVVYSSATIAALSDKIEIDQHWRAIESADNGSRCLKWEGAGAQVSGSTDCQTPATLTNNDIKLAYNANTKQIVFNNQNAGAPVCLDYEGDGSRLRAKDCAQTEINDQQWSILESSIEIVNVAEAVICRNIGGNPIGDVPATFVCTGSSPEWSWYEL